MHQSYNGLNVPSLRGSLQRSAQQSAASASSYGVSASHFQPQSKGLDGSEQHYRSDISQGAIGANTMLANGAVSQIFRSANLPEVVKTTFKALHDVIVAQGETIQRLERTVADKADWAEVEASLAARATVSDVNRSLGELTQIVDRKAESEKLREQMEERPLRTEMEGTISDLYELIRKGEKERVEMQNKINALEEENSSKASAMELDKFASKADLGASKAKVDDFDAKLKQTMTKAEILSMLNEKYMSKDDITSMLHSNYCKANDVHIALQNKCDVQNVIDALDTKCDRKNMEVQWKELSDAMLELEDKITRLETDKDAKNNNGHS